MTIPNFEVKIAKNLIKKMTSQTKNEVKRSVRNIAQDLARTSSESAPHLTGDLEDSYAIAYQTFGGRYTATVEFSVFHNGFNYAMAMHEWTYSLGPKSQAKGGGTGMSGTTYPVGNKYLVRVLEGERKEYHKYVGEQIRKSLGG